jgi:rfaE bifunctional protein nucleotidyltransferase chain/domain
VVTVLANGCFDLLHVGHVRHLQEARAMGERLIVALTLDAHVGKGAGRPVQSWGDRAEMLRALRCVDTVVASTDLAFAILAFRPAIVAKGQDWVGLLPFSDTEAARSVGAKIRFTTSEKRSTTELIERIRCA